jgi:hypothetical protein
VKRGAAVKGKRDGFPFAAAPFEKDILTKFYMRLIMQT